MLAVVLAFSAGAAFGVLILAGLVYKRSNDPKYQKMIHDEYECKCRALDCRYPSDDGYTRYTEEDYF